MEKNLINGQAYLDGELQHLASYSSQLSSNEELTDILEGFSKTDRQVIYGYQSQVYPQLIRIQHDNPVLSDITIYTNNTTAVNLIPYFESLTDYCLDNTINPNSIYQKRAYYNSFWTLYQNSDNQISLDYYYGFMHSALSRIIGVLKLSCDFSFFTDYCSKYPETSFYLFCNGQITTSLQTTPQSDIIIDTLNSVLLSEEPSIKYINNHSYILSSIGIARNNIYLIGITPVSFLGKLSLQLYGNLFICILLVILSIAVSYITIFKPFQEITDFSEHMRNIHAPELSTYNISRLPNNEIGDLITSYNDMVSKTNELSRNLHKQEHLLHTAELDALQAQLNPHFFYGTLETIRMIAEANEQEEISLISFSFGKLMRYSLSREYLVPVDKEIDIVRLYLQIQEIRLFNRFEVQWILPNITLDWKCPKFVLYSLVENVFSHDVNHTRRVVHITISITTDSDDLIFKVENDGPGLSKERLDEIRYLQSHPEERNRMTSESNGRSIFNITDRLKLFYGDGYSYSLDSTENNSTVSTVKIHKYIKAFVSQEGDI